MTAEPLIEGPAADAPPVRELSAAERRVLGVLVEKALTTPEYYPLTLKALVAGCNQKSNRHPHADYDDDTVLETVETLRRRGLAAVIHTSTGRTERYRHYLRHRFTLSEPQVAILTELLLRGRQTLGELRSRAARMVSLDSLEVLRDELRGLIEAGLVAASGPLERRGVEVDHALYRPDEGTSLAPFRESAEAAGGPADRPPVGDRGEEPTATAGDRRSPASAPPNHAARIAALEVELTGVRQECAALRADLDGLSRTVHDLLTRLGEPT